MVYGKSLRLGVYMMQEVFRLLGFQQTQEDVDIVKATLQILAPEHVVQRYIRNASDLHYDAAYVDTFLHGQDRAYCVNEVFDFTRKAGLEFLTWCDPIDYSLEAIIPPAHPLWSKLHDLSPETEAHVCDLLSQLRGTHRWAAAHPDYVKKARIPFETEAFLDCIVVPHRLTKIIQQGDANKKQNVICERGNRLYEIDFRLGEIIARTNGIKNIRQAISEMSISVEDEMDLRRLASEQFKRLWKQGHLYIFLPEKQ
jgi:hypothetical protein